MMKGSKFQHRQELADMLEQFLMQSEIVFSDQELSKEWFETMTQRASAIQNKLAVFNYVSHEQDTHKAIFDVPKVTQMPAPEPVVEAAPQEIVPESVAPEETVPPVVEQPTEVASFEAEESTPVVEEPETPVQEKEEEVQEEIKEEVAAADEVEAPKEEVVEEAPLVEKVLVAENPDFVTETKEEEVQEEVPTPALNKADLEVNDMHANSQTLADRLRVRAIGKLADTISLNERFLFSNELFNGNMEAFKRALNELDHIASIEDAKRYIDMQLCVENEWDKNDYSVKSFINLVERKFN